MRTNCRERIRANFQILLWISRKVDLPACGRVLKKNKRRRLSSAQDPLPETPQLSLARILWKSISRRLRNWRFLYLRGHHVLPACMYHAHQGRKATYSFLPPCARQYPEERATTSAPARPFRRALGPGRPFSGAPSDATCAVMSNRHELRTCLIRQRPRHG
jgi:hypothetical protein